MDGETVGIVANNSAVKGGVLFADSADKAARFIWLCDAFSIPLVYLADVPGLHDRLRGRARRHHPARRQDDHRRLRGHRAAVLASSCARPTARGSTRWPGPGFGPDATLALPTARIAVMGPEAAVNAVYANKIADDRRPGRARAVRRRTGGASTRRTSTSSGWPPTSCSTASSRPTSCAPSCCTAAPLRRAPGPRVQRPPARRAARLGAPFGARRQAPPSGVCGRYLGCERRHLPVRTLVPQAHSRFLGTGWRCAGPAGRDTSRSLLIFSTAQKAKPAGPEATVTVAKDLTGLAG